MAVWADIPHSEVVRRGRMDAEYYQPHFLQVQRRVDAMLAQGDAILLKDVASVEYGYMPMQDYVDESAGEPLLRVTNLRSNLEVDDRDIVYIPHSVSVPAKKRLETRDVLLVQCGDTTGKVGYMGPEHDGMIFPSFCLRVRSNGSFPAEGLALFLESTIGQTQIAQRVTIATVRPNTCKPDVETLVVPRFFENEKLAASIAKMQKLRKRSKQQYAQAEALLESALGLDKLDLAPRLCNERPYADVRAAERFDAEYFQPRMQNLIAALSCEGHSIADVATLSNRRFEAKAGVEFQYIEIGDVSGSGTADSNPVPGEAAPSRATWIVKPGDIITTTVRPIRRLSAIITNDQRGNVCSSGFAVLTPKNVAPELLLVYLRLPLICELLDLHTTASMYPAISTTDLMHIPIVLPKEVIREKIVAKVGESFEGRREARRVLDHAKAMVEKAILGEG